MRGNYLYKRIGERIASARKNRGISQETLSLVSEIDRTYLARIEQGSVNPSIKVLHKISRHLNMTMSMLLRGIG